MTNDFELSTPNRRREWITGAALFILGLLWFWYFRANRYTGGDSGQWDRVIADGAWLQRRQMLSFVAMQATFQITHALFGWTSKMAIALTSCLSGATAVVILWRMLRDRPAGICALGAAVTAGFTVLYYGHIETYSMSVTAMLFHLLAVQRTLEERWAPWTLAATFSLMLCFHLIAIFLLPAAVVVTFIVMRRQKPSLSGWAAFALGLSPVLLVWVVGFTDFVSLAFDEAVKEDFFVAPPKELIVKPWLFITHRDHRGDLSVLHKLTFMVWNAGLFLALLPWALYRARKEIVLIALTLYLGCLLIWNAIWAPLQYAADFDLFSFPWVVVVLLVAMVVGALPGRAVWLGLLIGTNAILLMTRPLIFADLNRRGEVELTVAETPELDQAVVFLDESFRLPVGTYRHLAEGAHVITIRRPQWPRIRRVILTEAGEAYRIEVGDQQLRIVRTAP